VVDKTRENSKEQNAKANMIYVQGVDTKLVWYKSSESKSGQVSKQAGVMPRCSLKTSTNGAMGLGGDLRS
jgi:hypothetical protein